MLQASFSNLHCKMSRDYFFIVLELTKNMVFSRFWKLQMRLYLRPKFLRNFMRILHSYLIHSSSIFVHFPMSMHECRQIFFYNRDMHWSCKISSYIIYGLAVFPYVVY